MPCQLVGPWANVRDSVKGPEAYVNSVVVLPASREACCENLALAMVHGARVSA